MENKKYHMEWVNIANGERNGGMVKGFEKSEGSNFPCVTWHCTVDNPLLSACALGTLL